MGASEDLESTRKHGIDSDESPGEMTSIGTEVGAPAACASALAATGSRESWAKAGLASSTWPMTISWAAK